MKICNYLYLLFFPLSLFAQQKEFLSLRFNEDYSYLKDDTLSSFYKSLKFHSFSNKISNSIGGEVRLQTLNFTNQNWEDNGNHTEFYQRFLLHSDLKIGKSVRFFSQIVSTNAQNRLEPNRTLDENQFDLSQLFVDVAFRDIKLRIGRQEMPLGGQRLYSTREGLNNRLSFDIVRFIYKNDKSEGSAFYGNPVLLNKKVFDDKTNQHINIWGVYHQFKNIFKSSNLDIYYLGNHYQTKKYANITGAEIRHSVGIRSWGKNKIINYDFETVYQFGSINNQKISAYTVSLDAYHQLAQTKLKPKIGFKAEIISGDKSINDNTFNTFNPLFPRGAYFGLAALIGPANLIDFHPYSEFELSPKASFSVDYDSFWRHSINDALYNSPMQIIAANKSNKKHIGNQLGISIAYQPIRFLTMSVECTWFHTGSYLKEVNAINDIVLIGQTTQLKF
ncbi:alginate export family protein [Emticicia sp. SJ17W-69]|uniref:alginate export family protein n=1 Tax=Emticicia sp. SJ17W-69 TaxID=3421657 RepID=UPI003EBD1C37